MYMAVKSLCLPGKGEVPYLMISCCTLRRSTGSSRQDSELKYGNNNLTKH